MNPPEELARVSNPGEHGIMESEDGKGLEQSSNSIQSQPCPGQDTSKQSRLLKALSRRPLNTARLGAASTFLVNLFQRLTTLTVINFFLISKLNIPSFSSYASLRVLSLH